MTFVPALAPFGELLRLHPALLPALLLLGRDDWYSMDGGSFDGCCAWELHLGLSMEGTVGSPGASDLELRPCAARLSSMLTRRLAAFALVCTDEATGIMLAFISP